MPTAVTKTVNPGGGKQYTSLTLALASLPANLVTNDIDAEIVLDKATYNEGIFINGFTTDATHRIRIRCADGASFYDAPNKLTTALRPAASQGVLFMLPSNFSAAASRVDSNFVFVDGVQFMSQNNSTHANLFEWAGFDGEMKRCMLWEQWSAMNGNIVALSGKSRLVQVIAVRDHNADNINRNAFQPQYDNTLIQCLAITTVPGSAGVGYQQGYANGTTPRGCASFGFPKFAKNTTAGATAGYNATNIAAGDTPGTNNKYSLVAADQFISVVQGAFDLRLKAGSALASGGVRDQVYTDDLDILKQPMSTTSPNIGPTAAIVADTQAPTLTLPTGVQTGMTTATIGATTDEANGTLRGLATTNATETAATVKASGTAQAVSSTGAKTINVSGLTPATQYYAHLVHTDAAGNDSTVVNSAAFTTASDTVAPILSSPSATATGGATATGNVTTDDATGTLYFLASTNPTESAATVKAGSQQAVTASGAKTVAFTGLSPSTTYYPHFLHRDAAGNDSAVANGSSFTTSAVDVTAPTLTSPLGTSTGTTTGTGGVTTNEPNGTLYSYVSTNPTENAATVKASGTQQAISSTGAKTVNFTGLTQGTQYYAHFLHRDASGNDSTVANSAGFTTTSTLGSLTVGPILNASGGPLTNTAVVWSWLQAGRVGARAGKVAQDGSGTTDDFGMLTVSAISKGAGELMVAEPGNNIDDDRVFYSPGTAV